MGRTGPVKYGGSGEGGSDTETSGVNVGGGARSLSSNIYRKLESRIRDVC